MFTKEKLIKLGWTNAAGESLDWRFWQVKAEAQRKYDAARAAETAIRRQDKKQVKRLQLEAA